MSTTLEEAIAKYEERVKILIESMNACDLDDPVEKMLARNDAKGADEQRQLADWLKELQERRKLPVIVYCGDCKHYKIDHPRANGYHCCYRCHNIFPMKEDDFCSRAERRTDDRTDKS